jgi:hypothetical protein
VEVNQRRQAEKQAAEDVAGEIVDRVVEETNVERESSRL